MNVYRIEFEQHARVGGAVWSRETVDVRARSASEALRRGTALARENGFMKSRPLEVVSMTRLTRDLR